MTKEKKIGIYAGSFDPFTFGHLNIIERASKLFDEVIVLVAINTSKKTLFTPEERLDLVRMSVSHIENIRLDVLEDGLVAHYYQEVGASALIRGLRNATDFDYEFSIASANALQGDTIETVILYAADEYRFMSSSLIKEIAYFDGDVSRMVPKHIDGKMKEKYNN